MERYFLTNKYKYLLKNIGLLTLSSFGSKIISFFLVPLYTAILTTTEYGIFDMVNTTISLLIPFFSICISDGVLRFAMEGDENKSDVFSIGLKVSFIGSIPIVLFVVMNCVFHFSSIINDYAILFLILYYVNILSSLVISFSRGIGKIKEVAVSSVICSFVIIGLNIILLVYVQLGLLGYFLANILGLLMQGLYLLFSCNLCKYINLRCSNNTLKNKMLTYCKPLIANNVAWWVNNASDRYVVTFFCGIAQNGLYSVGYKIPSLLNMLQSIFGQAWTLSATKDFDPDDKNGFFSVTYEMYNCSLVLSCSVIIIFSRVLAKILYSNAFFSSWVFVPFLSISVVFGALAGYIGGIFSAVMDSSKFAKSAISGAIINTILNIVFVSAIGPLGAAISTAVSYFIVWVVRVKSVFKYIKIRINLKRDLFAYFILVVQSILLILTKKDSFFLFFTQFVLFILLVVIFKKIIKKLIDKFLGGAK